MFAAPTFRLRNLFLAVLAAALAVVFASPARAQDKVLRVGTLKLIHGISAYFYEKFVPPGYTVEVIPFESPTDGKNAVLTGTVDTCIHGIAAFILGAAAGEPVVIVANANNRGMAIMAGVNTDIKSMKDLKGKKVAIWPGSTQEAVILERLRMEGMTIKDIQPIRLQFSDMAGALARGDVDAYVGAEPAGRHQPRQRHRQAGRISLLDADRPAQHDPVGEPEGGEGKSRSHQADRGHAPQGGRIRDGESAADRRDGDAEARPAEKVGRTRGAECRARLEDRRRLHDAGNAYAKLMFENKQIRQEIDLKQFVTTQFQ